MIKPHSPSSSSLSLAATSTMPNTNSSSLNGILSTEWASISGVLTDFHLFNLFSQTSTITGSVFTSDSDLLCSLSLMIYVRNTNNNKQRTHHCTRKKKGKEKLSLKILSRKLQTNEVNRIPASLIISTTITTIII